MYVCLYVYFSVPLYSNQKKEPLGAVQEMLEDEKSERHKYIEEFLQFRWATTASSTGLTLIFQFQPNHHFTIHNHTGIAMWITNSFYNMMMPNAWQSSHSTNNAKQQQQQQQKKKNWRWCRRFLNPPQYDDVRVEVWFEVNLYKIFAIITPKMLFPKKFYPPPPNHGPQTPLFPLYIFSSRRRCRLIPIAPPPKNSLIKSGEKN